MNRGPFLNRQLKAVMDLWRSRELVTALAARNLRVKYKASALGLLWALMSPLFTVGVLAVVFTHVVRIEMVNFWAFILSGYFVFRFVLQTLTAATSELRTHGSLSRAAAFPIDAPILAATLSRLFEFLMELILVLAAVAVFHHGRVPASFLLLPWLVIIQVVLALGLALPIAALSVFFRDVEHVLPVVMTALFYVSGVFYPISLVPENWRPVFLANPIAALLELYHVTVYDGLMPALTGLFGVSMFALLVFLAGYGIFNSYGRLFAEIV